jgi:hypothetical protein
LRRKVARKRACTHFQFTESDDLAVDYSVVGQPGEGLHDSGILAVEALVVSGPQVRYAVRFDRDRPVAIELPSASRSGWRPALLSNSL